jgi:hypothetical protein
MEADVEVGIEVEIGARVLVEQEIERYFTSILPARIDADFRGNGYEMLWRMLAAHDTRDLAPPPTPPSPRALAMAARVRAACPPIISDAVLAEGGQIVLGRFSQDARFTGTVVRSNRRVEIFARAMKYAQVTTLDELRAEIALTIFHEYIHYFESFLLLREQPLRGREVGAKVEQLGLDEARRRDRAYTRRRTIKFAAAIAAAAAVVIAIVLSTRPPPKTSPHVETAAEREAYAQGIAREKAHLAEMDRALLTHLDEIVARDLGPQDAVALIGQDPAVAFAPGHESRLVASSELIPDPRSPEAPATIPNAALTYLWSHDRDTFPPRLVGIAWSSDGHPVRIAATTR